MEGQGSFTTKETVIFSQPPLQHTSSHPAAVLPLIMLYRAVPQAAGGDP